ncbi:MAG TPA: PP2C family protein-serine/threonine phosphatase [Candidatus Kryptonia bacterium]
MKIKPIAAVFGIAAVAGLAIFVYLLPSYTGLYSVDSRLTPADARSMSESLAKEIDVKIPARSMNNTTFGLDEIALVYLQSSVGTKRGNELVRSDSIPLNYWTVIWFDPSQQSKEGEIFRAKYSQGGHLISYSITIPDTAAGKLLDESKARDALNSYWRTHNLSVITGTNLDEWKEKSSEPVRLEHRQDWTFTFTKQRADSFGLEGRISIRISGDQLVSFEKSYEAPSEFTLLYNSRSTPYVFLTFASWVVIFVLFAIGLVIFLKRYNEGEAGVGSSLLVSGTYYIAAALSMVLSFPSISKGVQISTLNLFYEGLVVLAALLLLWTPLLGILTFSAWGIGESSARAQWPNKLFTFDAATHLKFFNEKVGISILRGYAFGLILMGLYAIANPAFSLRVVLANSSTPLDSYVPSVQVIAESFALALFCETFYRFGVLSFFGKKRLVTGITVSAVLFVPSLFYSLPYGEYQILPRILITVVLSLALTFIFLRYDFLTVLVASILFNLAHSLVPLFGSENSYYRLNTIVAFAILVLPVILSFVALVKKQHFELSVNLMPKHIRRISERERMARELEIAKNVQINLLPRSNPSPSDFEFGGICIPALEVGGDYYDFVQLPNGMIGTAIADVSGKGLPAAIYMTLTKGALQAYGEDQPSPRKVLNRINSIVFKSISRGTFISMIYAVLDTRTKVVRFARAGHNPLVFFSTGANSAKLFTPNGLALGLDNSDKFNSTLEEMEIALKPGDVLVFYTDGFSEAMDSQANEFGEPRLVELIESARHLPVDEMLTEIEEGVRKFVGNAPQHDDMTMVAIKVKPTPAH